MSASPSRNVWLWWCWHCSGDTSYSPGIHQDTARDWISSPQRPLAAELQPQYTQYETCLIAHYRLCPLYWYPIVLFKTFLLTRWSGADSSHQLPLGIQNCCCDSNIWIIMLNLYLLNLAPHTVPDSKVHGAYMGPTRARQDPGELHAGPMILAIWGVSIYLCQ